MLKIMKTQSIRMLLFSLLLGIASVVYAQVQVTGRVVDITGEPIIGANVVLKGTGQGTITDFDGKFSLSDLPKKGTLVVSYIGYVDQTVKIEGGNFYKIVLSEDTETLEEVVVVGYGTQKKLNITGAIDVVSSNTLEKMPVSSITQSLQRYHLSDG